MLNGRSRAGPEQFMKERIEPACIDPPDYWGMPALILIMLFTIFFGCGNDEYTEDLNSIKVRLAMIEERLVQLEKMEQRISSLEFQLKEIQESGTRLDNLVVAKPEAEAPV